MIYFAPQYQGLVLQQGDMIQSAGMGRDIAQHIDQFDEHPQWEGAMFCGMPAYLINMNYDGRLVKYTADALYFIGQPAAYFFVAMTVFFFMLLCFGVNPWLAMVGGFAYGLSTYFYIIIAVGHITKMIALAFAPGLIGSIYYAYRKNMFIGAALTGVFAAIEIGANHFQITYYFLMIMLALFINELVLAYKAKTLPKFMSYEECMTLLQTIRNDIDSPTNARDFAIIVLFLNTGMRLSELTGLDLQSFSRDLTNVKVLGKGNKERIVYLNDFAVSAVKEYLEVRLDPKYVRTSDKAFFLSSREQRISAKTVQWMAHKYFNLAGLGNRGLSVHKLRHTAATLMFQSGKVDIRVLKDLLGHEQLNTTQIYTHVVNENIEKAVAQNPLAGTNIKKPKTSSATK
jgi:integrase